MFQVGDYVVYGTKGVCKVEKIGVIESLGNGRMYYTLAPVYIKGSTVFTPIDNQKVVLRSVITKDEALKLIEEIPEIESLWVENEKRRENEFKDLLTRCDCRELVSMIKNLYNRKQERIAEGKKVTVSDEKFFKMAEDSLYGELAISLGMSRDEVGEFISSRIDQGDMVSLS